MDELRIGLIGTGAIGRTHIERINGRLRGGRVVACSDVNTAFGREVAGRYGCEFFEDGEALAASDGVDAVIVATVDEYHEKYVLAAIRAGKYVFCEKPLAPKPEACRRIMEAEMAGGRKLLQVGFMRRYDAAYNQLKKAVHSGKYGLPLMVHCAHRVPSVPDYYDTPMAVENSLIHEIDILRWLLGEDYAEVQVVFAKKTRYSNEHLHSPQIMRLKTEAGIQIDVEAFICCRYAYDIKCEVCCEDGIVSLPDPSLVVERHAASCAHPLYEDWTDRFEEAYNVEIQAWLDASREGRVDGPTAWDGYLGQVTAQAASQSRDTQTTVTIPRQEKPAFYL